MPRQSDDPDEIAARARAVAEQEREKYIDLACGPNDHLRDQVLERIGQQSDDQDESQTGESNDKQSKEANEEQGSKKPEQQGGKQGKDDANKEDANKEGAKKKGSDEDSDKKGAGGKEGKQAKKQDDKPDGNDKGDKNDKGQESGKDQKGDKKDAKQSDEQEGKKSDKKADESDKDRQPGRMKRLWRIGKRHPKVSLTIGAVALVLLLVVGAGIGVSVWAYEEVQQADKDKQKAEDKQKKTEKSEEEFKTKYHRSETARKQLKKQLDEVSEQKKSQEQDADNKQAVLDFLKSTILAAGRPAEASLAEAYWKGAMQITHDVSLRKAVDLAAARIDSSFQDRPLAEAMAREIVGTVYLNLGEPDHAVPQYKQALELRAANQDAENFESANCRNRLAIAYRLAGQTQEASRLFEQNRESAAYAEALVVRGKLLLAEGKPAEAELRFRQSLNSREATDPDQVATYEAQSLLGEALLEQQKFEQAETNLLSAYQGLEKLNDNHSTARRNNLIRTAERLVELNKRWGRPDQVEHWMKQLESMASAKP